MAGIGDHSERQSWRSAMAKKLHLNAFTQLCPTPQSEGQWKHPLDQSSFGYRDVGYWVDVARTLERGGFDALFFADIHGTYDVYGGSRDAAVRHAVQIPDHDPTLLVPALAHATRSLGFACTYSTTYHPPYHTAKVFSTLDHLTGGRIAWNIVTSYLRDAYDNLGLGEPLPHDQRYDKAEEYMEVVYKLWEHSWEEDAVVLDIARDIHTDPRKVHQIDHEGRHYSVRGPHLCEPSPQRTPLLFQAGQSGRGVEFAARHAEALFMVAPSIPVCRSQIEQVHAAMRRQGRDPAHIKVLVSMGIMTGIDDAEAQAKAAYCRSLASAEGGFALFGGWTGIDLSGFAPDQRIVDTTSDGMQYLASYFTSVDPERDWTIADIADFLALASVTHNIVGGPATVADELERWIDEAGIDGISLLPIYSPGCYTDFVDLVVPELRRRGRLHDQPGGTTLRERYFGAGHPRLAPDHPAHRALPPWKMPAMPEANAAE
jgi:FMN-dependent oxidoreductase (nitrilotriacetate monooxygenase family)